MANIFLEEGENYTVGSRANIFGSIGNETINIVAGAINISLNQNIENIRLSRTVNDFKFQQTGNQLRIFNTTGELIVTAPVQGDEDGTQIFFKDNTTLSAVLSQGRIYLGTVEISNDTPTPIGDENVTNIDKSTFSHINNGLGTLSSSSSEGVSALDSTEHWNKSNLTYSFNQTIPDSYYTNEGLTTNWSPLNKEQQTVVHSIMEEIDNLLNIQLTEVQNNGDIRLNIVEMEENVAGFAFYPFEDPNYGGDVFLSQEYNNNNSDYDFGLNEGEAGYSTIVHEVGHALGLKHPFEGEDTLTSEVDNQAYTVMSYTYTSNIKINFISESSGLQAEYKYVQPKLYSLYDVSALHAIYGANMSSNGGDNIYTFNYSDFLYETIWDVGGNDTFDLSATKGESHLDLRGGTLNNIDKYSKSEVIDFYQEEVNNSRANNWIEELVNDVDREGLLYQGENNIGIANGVIIENALMGSGNDIVYDNMVDNIIELGRGDDRVYLGAGGYDTVDGGDGVDSIYINMLESQVNVAKESDTSYTLQTNDFAVVFSNIEEIHLNDNILYADDLFIA